MSIESHLAASYAGYVRAGRQVWQPTNVDAGRGQNLLVKPWLEMDSMHILQIGIGNSDGEVFHIHTNTIPNNLWC